MIFPAVYFSSCAKLDADDNEAPVISDVRMNFNDTIRLEDRTVKTYNVSLDIDPNRRDTLVIRKWVYISARFTDNAGLSTFKVELQPLYKDKKGVAKDSTLTLYKLGRKIFGKDSLDVKVFRNQLLQLPDSIVRITKDNKTETLWIVEDDYELKVACVDIAGNRDSVFHPVRIVSRKNIIKSKP